MNIENIIESFQEEEELRPRFEEEIVPCDILFVTDTKDSTFGGISDFESDAGEAFYSCLDKIDIKENVTYRVVSALKLFGEYTYNDLSAEAVELHRNITLSEVQKIKPKLIIPLGNLAFRILTKRSGVDKKRGCEFDLDGIKLVPTVHPRDVYNEPGLEDLFIQDVTLSYDRFIRGKNKFSGSPYVYCNTVDLAIAEIANAIKSGVVSIDLETTGLDFKKDKITTFGCAYGEEKAFVIPMFHKDTPFTTNELSEITYYLNSLTGNEKVIKVMHNSKFDVKFLRELGVECNNIEDTQVIHALLDENKPHRLIDLVKQHFPEELPSF